MRRKRKVQANKARRAPANPQPGLVLAELRTIRRLLERWHDGDALQVRCAP